MWFRKRKQNSADVAHDLREQAFSIALPANSGAARGQTTIGALFMETGYAEAVASLVCFADGTTSLYLSNGGGMIGAGEHASVRTAATTFFAVGAHSLHELTGAAEHPLPRVGQVRFYARTDDGLWVAEAPEADLGGGSHQLSQLFFTAHGVITAIRETGAGQ